jgi:glutamine amidotransferase
VCRFVAYLGEPIVLDEMLFLPDSSIVEQSVHPQLLSAMNLAGFGVLAWDAASADPERPWTYRTPGLPFFDRNLRALSRKARATALIAHVRGVVLSDREVVDEGNVHPFRFEGVPTALAMNGDLEDFPRMRYDLLGHMRPELARQIEGTTDSEWLYGLIMSQVADPTAPADPDELAEATVRTLAIVREVRARHGLERQSAVNLVLSDGRCLVATRFAYDYGWYHEDWTFAGRERVNDFTTLWFAQGTGYACHDGEWGVGAGRPESSIVIASEPLTHDRSRWLEVPEYAMLVARPARIADVGLATETRELDL